MLADAPTSEPAPMSVAATLPDVTGDSAAAPAAVAAGQPAQVATAGTPVFLTVPDGLPAALPGAVDEPTSEEAALAARMEADSSAVASAYVQPAEPQGSRIGSFFGRVIDTVNPF
jgi:hypothetical protein